LLGGRGSAREEGGTPGKKESEDFRQARVSPSLLKRFKVLQLNEPTKKIP